jgi:hypothetical protein
MSRGPWKKKKAVVNIGSPADGTNTRIGIWKAQQNMIEKVDRTPLRGGFYWLVMRKAEAEGFNEEIAAQRAIQELRSQFTTDAEFAACPLFPEILAYYGNDWKLTIEALKKAGI